MVALFNGVGGGAVALIAWSSSASPAAFAPRPDVRRDLSAASRRSSAAISFWGSNIAFVKLQELIDGKPVKPFGSAQAAVNGVLLLVSVACGGRDRRRLARRAPDHRDPADPRPRSLGNFVVLPIGGADMPVVISTLNAFTGLSAAATGIALDNTALIVAGMIVGASGTILTKQMAEAMNRSITSVLFARLRRRGHRRRRGAHRRGRRHRCARTSAADVAIQMAYARLVVVVPGYGMAVAQAQHAVREMAKLLEAQGRRGQVRDPPGRGPHAGPHERAARRGRRPLRPAQGDGRHQRGVPARRRLAGHRRQRRHQPRCAQQGRLADLRDADPRRRRVRQRHRAEALDERPASPASTTRCSTTPRPACCSATPRPRSPTSPRSSRRCRSSVPPTRGGPAHPVPPRQRQPPFRSGARGVASLM